MTIVSDAVSLILLAKVNLLEMFVERNKIIVPKSVYEEVSRGKDKGRRDSMLIERLITEKRLLITLPNKTTKNKIERLFNIKGGELEVIALTFGEKHTILTDDKRCLNVANALKIDFITSLDVVVTLYRRSAISKERALECIDGLEEYGWYSRDLIKNYRGAIK